MESALQKKIKNYLEKNNMSVASLERDAGLKTNVVRNILRGLSKRPTAVTLRSIANVMGCTVEDLLGRRQAESSKSLIAFSSDEGLFLEDPELLNNCLHALLEIVRENNYKPTLQQTLLILGEIYTYTIEKNPPQIDKDFIGWFIRKAID